MRSWFAAGIAGGLVMFVAMSILHVATPLGQVGFKPIPNEAQALSALHASIGDKSGLYFFPWVDMSGKSSRAAAEGKFKANPSGLLIYHPPGAGAGLSPPLLLAEFLKEVVTALIAAFLLSRTAIAGYLPRVGIVALVGLAGALTTNVSYLVWYGFPLDYTLAYAFMDFSGYLAAGLAIAGVLRKPAG
jgi:hypothetical protein